MENKLFLGSFMLDGFKMEMEFEASSQSEAVDIISDIAIKSGGTDIQAVQSPYASFRDSIIAQLQRDFEASNDSDLKFI